MLRRLSLVVLSGIAFVASPAKHPAAPLPWDVRVGYFGCVADRPITEPGTLPQWHVKVWSRETINGPRWTGHLNSYDAGDPKSLNKALKDCADWVRLVAGKIRTGEIRRPLANEIEKESKTPPERPQ